MYIEKRAEQFIDIKVFKIFNFFKLFTKTLTEPGKIYNGLKMCTWCIVTET